MHSFLVHDHGILFRVKQVGHTIYILHAHVAVVADLRLSGLALPGSNKDNTVGSTRSVYRSRSGILQYVNALYVGRVQAVDIASRNAVDDIKWRCVASRAQTTYIYLISFTGHSRRLCNIHTGSFALQCAQWAYSVQLFKVFAVHLHGCTRHQFFLLNAIAHHNHLVQRLVFFLQNDVQGLRRSLDILSLKADIRYFQH